MRTHVDWRRWSALPTVTALLVAVGLTACNDASSGPLGVDPVTNSPSASVHTVETSSPFTTVTDLLAGQDHDVGSVEVVDDGSNTLTVSYVIEDPTGEDWCIAEIHTHAGEDLEDFPLTRKNNPKVGQFDYPKGSNSFPVTDTDCTKMVDVDIPFSEIGEGVDSGDEVLVAAHAAVVDRADPETVAVTSAAGDMMWGPRDDYALPGASGWGTSFQAAAVASPNSAWDWPATLGGTWISVDADAELDDPNVDQWLRVQETVEIPEDAYYPRLSLALNADNATEFFIDGTSEFVFGTPNDANDPPERGAHETAATGLEFSLATGTNELAWVVRNYFPQTTTTSNPVALIYDGSTRYWTGETAWGDGTRFTDRGNWATYFEYMLKPEQVVISGWDQTRGGFVSFKESGALTDARAAFNNFISGEGVSPVIEKMGTISSSNLMGVDIVFFGTVKGNSEPISPLSSGPSGEQTALKEFVEGGGCAVLVVDNATFGDDDDDTDTANNSLVSPFGLSVTGTLSGERTSTATSATSPVLNGVTTITHNWGGWFESTGSATVLATIDDNSKPSALEGFPGTGRITAFSDASQFFDSEDAGTIDKTDNTQLFVNALAACF